MKKRGIHIIRVAILVIIVLGIVASIILYDLTKTIEKPIDLGDKKLLETITVGSHTMARITHAYNLYETSNTIVATLYSHTSPVKSVQTYTFENDKLIDFHVETYHSTKLDAIVNGNKENYDDYKRKGNIISGVPKNVTIDYSETKEEIYGNLEESYSKSFYKVDENGKLVEEQ